MMHPRKFWITPCVEEFGHVGIILGVLAKEGVLLVCLIS